MCRSTPNSRASRRVDGAAGTGPSRTGSPACACTPAGTSSAVACPPEAISSADARPVCGRPSFRARLRCHFLLPLRGVVTCAAENHHNVAHMHDIACRYPHIGDDVGIRRGNLYSGLIRLDLEDGIVFLDLLALAHLDREHLTLMNALSKVGQPEFLSHRIPPRRSTSPEPHAGRARHRVYRPARGQTRARSHRTL